MRAELARRVLAARGMPDCVTFGFMAQSDGGAVRRHAGGAAADQPDRRRPRPDAPDADRQLALAAQRNAARGYPDVALLEIGPEYRDRRRRRTSAGRRRPARRRNAAHLAGASRAVDAMDAKGDLWAVLAALGVPMDALVLSPPMRRASTIPAAQPRCGRDRRRCWATFGETAPDACCAALDLAGPSVAFQLDLDAIGEPKRRRKAAPDLPAFQPIRRDFAFLVDSAVTADAVLRAARGADRTLITGVSLFDVYQGERLPEGKSRWRSR